MSSIFAVDVIIVVITQVPLLKGNDNVGFRHSSAPDITKDVIKVSVLRTTLG